MKTLLFLILIVLLASTTAFPQAKLTNATTSLETAGETFLLKTLLVNKQGEKNFTHIRPVKIMYKNAEWHLMVVKVADEKYVVHISPKQLKAIAAIIEAKDGKTHYLEVTNFFDVFDDREIPEVDEELKSSIEAALQQRRWYKNNSLFMISATSVGDQHVIRFKLPFPNNARVCRHVRAEHNLKEGYFEVTPAAFMNLLIPSSEPNSFNVSAN